jgi:hypothetical protein
LIIGLGTIVEVKTAQANFSSIRNRAVHGDRVMTRRHAPFDGDTQGRPVGAESIVSAVTSRGAATMSPAPGTTFTTELVDSAEQ